LRLFRSRRFPIDQGDARIIGQAIAAGLAASAKG
jgi:hypothetical protein